MTFHTKAHHPAVRLSQKLDTNHTLGLNSLDLHLGIGLSVAHLALHVLFGLISENCDLLGLAALYHLTGNHGTVHIGGSNLCTLFSKHCHHGEFHGIIVGSVQLFNIDHIDVYKRQ